MKKLGFGEILTIVGVLIGGAMVIVHPDMWEKVAATLGVAIFMIAIFIGYGDDE